MGVGIGLAGGLEGGKYPWCPGGGPASPQHMPLGVPRIMFFIIIIIFIAITFLIMIFHVCHKLCQDPVPLPSYGDPQGPVPPPLAPLPALPSLPSGAIPVGLEPPPYSEVGPTWQWVLGAQLGLAWGEWVGCG